MKRRLYIKSHSVDLLPALDNHGGPFTAEEHAYMTRLELVEHVRSRESLLRWYLSCYPDKLPALAYLIRSLTAAGYRSVLSVGAGPCVLEYLLKLALPDDARVVAADFDSFLVQNARALLPGIAPVEFDMFTGDVPRLVADLGPFDVAVFFGSSYVMDDGGFVRLLKALASGGVAEVFDFQAGYLRFRRVVRALLLSATSYVPARRGEAPCLGKFHGFARSRGELRKLYAASGLRIANKRRPLRLRRQVGCTSANRRTGSRRGPSSRGVVGTAARATSA